MRIALVRLPNTLEEMFGKLKSVGSILPPLGLAYLAGFVRDKGFPDIHIIDAVVLNLGMSETVEEILNLSPDIVGIQTYTFNYKKALTVCAEVKKRRGDIATVLGGPHIAVFPEKMLENDFVDYVVIGEGEKCFYNLVRKLNDKKHDFSGQKGLGWKRGGNIFVDKTIDLIPDLSSLPLPARDLLPMDLYKSSAAKKGKRSSQVISSRGCAYNCSFCSSSWAFGRGYRTNSVTKILEEMKQLNSAYGVDDIQFLDDLFTTDKRHVLELCDRLVKEKIKIPWTANARVDSVDEEVLSAMKKAGCYLLCYGVETGSEKLLGIINKGATLDQARRAVHLTKKSGIIAHTMFMMALPTETHDDSMITVDFAVDLNAEIVNFTPYIPLEGTRLYQFATKSGKIPPYDIEKLMKFDQISYIPEGRTEEEIALTVKKAYSRYYIRPGYIKNLLTILQNYPLKNLTMLFVTMVRVLFGKR